MPSMTQRYHTPGDNIYRQQLWSPEDVLDLCEDGRCVGHAHTRGRRCQMRINHGNARAFSRTLDAISEQPPDPEQLRFDLNVLAKLGLCIRFHQYQAEALVERWISKIRAAYPTPVRSDLRRMSAVRRQLSQQISDAGWITGYSNGTSTPTSARLATVPLDESTGLGSLRETIATMQETIRSAQECIERLSNSRHGSIQPPPITRVSTSDISSLALSRRSTITTDSISVTSASSSSSSSSRSATNISSGAARPESPSDTTRTQHHPTTANSRPSTPTTSTAASSSSSPPSPTTSSPPHIPCTTPHARRLPLPTYCPICQTGAPLSTLPPSSLTWCKSSCGQSVHASCFELWARQCTGNGRSPTCVMCRVDWVDTCECQGCLHVPRREVEVEEGCGICLEELREGEGEDGNAGLVWCKEGCGRSVHRDCFEVWEEHCVEAGRRATCVVCRAEWSRRECGC